MKGRQTGGRAHISIPIEARLWPKIRKTDTCWEWTASRQGAGYGLIGYEGKLWLAHRLVYTLLVGPIPEGLELDHLCRNRACVRPEHLEPVTRLVNQRRGAKAMATHCKQGHPFDEVNTAWGYTSKGGKRYRRRVCKTCVNASQRAYQARKRIVA